MASRTESSRETGVFSSDSRPKSLEIGRAHFVVKESTTCAEAP